jgi:hypothetical protein
MPSVPICGSGAWRRSHPEDIMEMEAGGRCQGRADGGNDMKTRPGIECDG